jgi:hypothetical protein
MDQPLIIATVMLLSFGVAGLLFGLIWRQPPFRVPSWLFGLSLALAAVGIWLVYSQMERLEQYVHLRDWKSVSGKIIDSRVVGERAFRPEIVYEYQVETVTYRDSTSLDPPGFGGRNAKHDAAAGVASEYPVGKAVMIHYDPADPSISRLKITPPWSVYGRTGLGGFMFGVGLLLAAIYARRKFKG